MITDVKTRKGTDAITSDHWHVVHAQCTGAGERRLYHRRIESEHDDRTACVAAARALCRQLRADGGATAGSRRDEVFVRRPGYKSLKVARSRRRRT